MIRCRKSTDKGQELSHYFYLAGLCLDYQIVAYSINNRCKSEDVLMLVHCSLERHQQ